MKKIQDSAVFHFNTTRRGLTGIRIFTALDAKACDPFRFSDTGSEKLLIIYANIRV